MIFLIFRNLIYIIEDLLNIPWTGLEPGLSCATCLLFIALPTASRLYIVIRELFLLKYSMRKL